MLAKEGHFMRKKFRITEGIDIVRAREELGLTQDELAERCGKTQRWVSWVERPEPHIISQETKEILEKALG